MPKGIYQRKAPSVPASCSIEGCDKPAKTRGWCNAHYLRWWKTGDPLQALFDRIEGSAATRFWAKVDKDGPVPEHRPKLGPCWLWKAFISVDGYGQFGLTKGHSQYAHRFAYELVVGPIPVDMELDHMCHNGGHCRLQANCPHRRCVNPAHLEPVTHKTNVLRGTNRNAENARKTHCIHGHEFTVENTRVTSRGRSCRTCERLRRK